MDPQSKTDPFDLLMNAGSSPDIWLFVGGPMAILLVIVAIYIGLIMLRRRRDGAAMDAAIDEASRGITTGPSDTLDELEAEDSEEAKSGPAQSPSPSAHVERAAAPAEVAEVRGTGHLAWLARLKNGLAKTRQGLAQNLEELLRGKAKLDDTLLEELHAALYRADVGVAVADQLVEYVRKTIGKDAVSDAPTVKAALKQRARELLESSAQTPLQRPDQGPWVVLVVGVNGVGKTTTIGKLGAHFLAADQSVIFAAADTFRAAAIEQLSVWGERLGIHVVKHKQGSDPAAVAYDGVKAAMSRHIDVLLIDTAGRLHAKQELMDELGKINRITSRDLPGAPHETWLVIDATTGQNAVAQVKAFSQVVKLTGLVVTKLDGTAKGGVLLNIAEQFKLPVRYIGVGEKAADLRQFNPADYADSLF